MAYNWIIFKNTAVAQSDGNACCIQTNVYPGPTSEFKGVFPAFGWSATVLGTDYGSPVAPYHVGANRINASGWFRIDLPNGPGTYRIRMSMGFNAASYTPAFYIREATSTGTILLDRSGNTTAVPSNQYMDVNGTVHTSAANWTANNTYFEFNSPSGTIYIVRAVNLFPITAIGIEYIPGLRTITIPGARIGEGQPAGTVIGDLSGQIDGIGLSLTDNASNKVTLSGNTILTGSSAIVYDPDNNSFNITLVETKEGYIGSPKTNIINIPIRPVYIPPTYPPKPVYPSGTWNGTEGSGFTSTPTDPTLITAKAMIGFVDVPLQRFTDDFYFKVQAFAKGGIKQVKCHLEGTTTIETIPRTHTYVDSNGNTQKFFGYIFKLDRSRFSQTGSFNVYFEAVPNNSAMQSTVVGPYLFHVADTEYDISVTVDGTQATNTSLLRFATIPEAINYCTTQLKQHALIEIVNNSVSYTLASGNVRGTVRGWFHIRAAAGLTVTLKELTRTYPAVTWYVPSGIRLGRGIELDFGNIDQWYVQDGVYWVWYDSGKVYSSLGSNAIVFGNPLGQPWRNNNSEIDQKQYFTEYECYNLPGGPKFNQLIRNSKFHKITGDVFTSTKQVAGLIVDDVDSSYIRNGFPAFSVQYSGAESVCTVQKVQANGWSGTGDTTKVSEAVSIDTTTNILTGTQNWATGTPIIFSADTVPSPLVAGTIYYTINQTATTFKVATSAANASAGTAVDLTTVGTNVRVHPWVTAGLVFRYATDVAFIIPFTGSDHLGQNWLISDIVNIINSKPGFAATLIDTNNTLGSIYLTREGASGLGAFGPDNCKTSAVTLKTGVDAHSDVLQMQNLTGDMTKNVIYTNVKVTRAMSAQIIFLSNSAEMNGIALINWICHSDPTSGAISQIGSGLKKHVLMYNNTFVNQIMSYRGALDSYFDAVNNVFYETRDSEIGVYDLATADRNTHFVNNTLPFETNSYIIADQTTLYKDFNNLDFRPAPSGSLVSNADYPLVPFDINWDQRKTLSALGAYEDTGYTILPKGTNITLTKAQLDSITQRTYFDSLSTVANTVNISYGDTTVRLNYTINPSTITIINDGINSANVNIDTINIPETNIVTVNIPLTSNTTVEYIP